MSMMPRLTYFIPWYDALASLPADVLRWFHTFGFYHQQGLLKQNGVFKLIGNKVPEYIYIYIYTHTHVSPYEV